MPIHPEHLVRIPEYIRKQMVFEEGYGKPFGILDSVIAEQTGGIASRSELFASSGVVILAKPTEEDLKELREGGVLWGYPHCVQQETMTQIAIERKQTLIAFEDMFAWGSNGQKGRHTFYKNNEMAGYCAVLHALQIKGIDGHYGNQRKVIIFSFGAVSRGAIYALKAHGFRDITICIQRPSYEVREEVLDCHYVTIMSGRENEARMVVVEHNGKRRALSELISESDIIINGTLQEPDKPINYVIKGEFSCIKPNSLIIDVSCDEGMGFYFAKPTSFKKPILKVGTIDYYAVDHTPNYFWESATRSISAALIIHLKAMMGGPENWEKDETIKQAINIEEGIVKKPNILKFQNREKIYPYLYI